MAKSEKVTSSSGNVFTDLGLPEADERLAKAELVRIIRRILTERALTQRAAAEVLGLRQPDVSDLIRGKLARFSRERIERFLVLLGMDVSIRVATKGRRRSRGHLTVEGDRLVIQPSRLAALGWEAWPTAPITTGLAQAHSAIAPVHSKIAILRPKSEESHYEAHYGKA